MGWNNGLVRTSQYWAKYTRSARRVRDIGPRSPFPLDPPGPERNGGVVESLRRARAWTRKR